MRNPRFEFRKRDGRLITRKNIHWILVAIIAAGTPKEEIRAVARGIVSDPGKKLDDRAPAPQT